MTTYSSEEIIGMGEMQFSSIFKNAFVSITLIDNFTIEGIITSIDLATNKNVDSDENLPTAVTISGKNISITRIKSIIKL